MEQETEPVQKSEEKDDCVDLINERDSLDPSYENALKLLNAGKWKMSFFDIKTRVIEWKYRTDSEQILYFDNRDLIDF